MFLHKATIAQFLTFDKPFGGRGAFRSRGKLYN